MTATLRKRFYTRKIESLHSADPHSWWRKTKQFLHHKHSDPLHSLEVLNPNVSLAEAINDFFVSVSAHLPPFDTSSVDCLDTDYTAQFTVQPSEIEQRLARISLHKSPGPMAYQTGSCVILPP